MWEGILKSECELLVRYGHVEVVAVFFEERGNVAAESYGWDNADVGQLAKMKT